MYIHQASGNLYHPMGDLKILHRSLAFFLLEIQTKVSAYYFEVLGNLNERIVFNLVLLNCKLSCYALHTKSFKDPCQLQHKIHTF